ncbi:MAG: tetratricopeptide repeat protein, partial [Bacteroidota bacterium]
MINFVSKLFLISLFIQYSFETSAQNKTIDSLQTILITAKEDANKVNTLNALSEQLWLKGDYNIAKKYAEDAFSLTEKNLTTSGGNEKSTYLNGKANAYNNIAIINRFLGNYPEALNNHFAALKIREEIGDKKGIARSYLGIGSIYNFMGNYPEALKNQLASHKIYEEIGDKWGIANSSNHIGIIYYELGNPSEALKNHFASLKTWQEIDYKSGVADAHNQIGLIYSEQGNYKEAIKNNFDALKIYKEIGEKDGIDEAYIYLGLVNTKLHNLSIAKKYFDDALALSKEIGSKEHIKDIYSGLAALDSTAGNCKNAFRNYKLYIIYRDSLVNQLSAEKITQIQLQYETDKKEVRTKAEQDKKDIQQRLVRNSIIAGLAGTLIFLIVVYRQRNKVKKEKDNAEKEKQRSDNLLKKSDELLLNILPSEVAEELKTTGVAKAKAFTLVTVMFTDFKDFTNVSEKVSAELLVAEIHYCFSAFDYIIQKHNIEKIKTVGDAYLCASGLP